MTLEERMERAGCFEDFVNHKGFEYMKSYYANKVQNITTRILSNEAKLETYEGEIQQIKGIRALLEEIQGDIDFLNNERSKTVTADK